MFITGTSSFVSYRPVTELDYGTLLCSATNKIGKQKHPCIFHIIAAGRLKQSQYNKWFLLILIFLFCWLRMPQNEIWWRKIYKICVLSTWKKEKCFHSFFLLPFLSSPKDYNGLWKSCKQSEYMVLSLSKISRNKNL